MIHPRIASCKKWKDNLTAEPAPHRRTFLRCLTGNGTTQSPSPSLECVAPLQKWTNDRTAFFQECYCPADAEDARWCSRRSSRGTREGFIALLLHTAYFRRTILTLRVEVKSDKRAGSRFFSIVRAAMFHIFFQVPTIIDVCSGRLFIYSIDKRYRSQSFPRDDTMTSLNRWENRRQATIKARSRKVGMSRAASRFKPGARCGVIAGFVLLCTRTNCVSVWNVKSVR
jgi:hypothetical protein